MIIGVDLDEVLADTLSAIIKFHNEVYGTELEKGDFNSYRFQEIWGGTRQEAIKKVYRFQSTNYSRNVKPVPGSIEGIKKLKEGNELILITSRPHDVKNQTLTWLSHYFPGAFSRVFFTDAYSLTKRGRRKSEICHKMGVDILVDDLLSCSFDCASEGIQVFLLNKPWNQGKELPVLITRCKNWEEIVECVENFKK